MAREEISLVLAGFIDFYFRAVRVRVAEEFVVARFHQCEQLGVLLLPAFPLDVGKDVCSVAAGDQSRPLERPRDEPFPAGFVGHSQVIRSRSASHQPVEFADAIHRAIDVGDKYVSFAAGFPFCLLAYTP